MEYTCFFKKSEINHYIDDIIYFYIDTSISTRASMYVQILTKMIETGDNSQIQETFNVLYGCKNVKLLQEIKSRLSPIVYEKVDELLLNLAKNENTFKNIKGYTLILARPETLKNEILDNPQFTLEYNRQKLLTNQQIVTGTNILTTNLITKT